MIPRGGGLPLGKLGQALHQAAAAAQALGASNLEVVQEGGQQRALAAGARQRPLPGGVLPAVSFISSRSSLSLSVGLSEDILVLAGKVMGVSRAASAALAAHGRLVAALAMVDPSRVARALSPSHHASAKAAPGGSSPACPLPPKLPSLTALLRALDGYIDACTAVVAVHSSFAVSLSSVLARGNLSITVQCPREWSARASDLSVLGVIEMERLQAQKEQPQQQQRKLQQHGGHGAGGGDPQQRAPPDTGAASGSTGSGDHGLGPQGGGRMPWATPASGDYLDLSGSPWARSVRMSGGGVGGRSAAGPEDFLALLAELGEASEDLLEIPTGHWSADRYAAGVGQAAQGGPSALTSACLARQALGGGGRSRKRGGGGAATGELCSVWLERIDRREVEAMQEAWGEWGGSAASPVGRSPQKPKPGAVCPVEHTERLLAALGAKDWPAILRSLIKEEEAADAAAVDS